MNLKTNQYDVHTKATSPVLRCWSSYNFLHEMAVAYWIVVQMRMSIVSRFSDLDLADWTATVSNFGRLC
jgi:hypothetical protein